MGENKTKADFIEVNELYFGKVGNGIKNRFLKQIVDFIFHDKVRKKKFAFNSFSITFEGTETEWFSNFMNGYFSTIAKVKCFFTKDNDSFVVYSVSGNPRATSFFSIPTKVGGYIEQRKQEWQGEEKKWKLDESSIKKSKEGKQYSLEYRGEFSEKNKDYNVFEHTVFKGIDKVVLQAFILKGGSSKVMSDVEKISHSIKML